MTKKPTYDELVQRIQELEYLQENNKTVGSDSVYQLMLESITDTVLITDHSGRIEYVCPNTSVIFGMSSKSVYELKHIERLIGNRILDVTKLSETGELNNIECTIEATNGQVKQLLINIRQVDLPIGSILFVMRDISDIHESYQKVRKSELKYKNIFNNLIDVYTETDLDGIFLEVSPSCEKHMGYSRKELIGTPISKYYVDPSVIDKHMEVFLQKGENCVEIEAYHKDGSKIPYFISSTLETGIDDKPVIVSIVRNLSSHKKSQDLIRDSLQKYSSMVDNIGIGVALISPEMEVLELNKKMREWFPNVKIGPGSNCHKIFNDPPSDTICDYCPTAKTLKDGEVHESITATPTLTGTRNFRIISSPIVDENGKIKAAIELVEDITERLAIENQLKKAQRLESLGTLAGGIAHDFNNILSSIIGFTELSFGKAKVGSILEDNLQEILAGGKRAKDLVGQILAFARQSEGVLKPIQIDIIIKEVLQFIRSSIPTTIEITSKIESDSLITGNDTQLHQIMMNLCTNAAQAMEKGGGILNVGLKDISITEDHVTQKLGLSGGDYLELSVSDTGSGIDPTIIDSIFDPYFTTKSPGEGTGLGLALVHGIVESYQGRIAVKSSLGKGTTFKLYLPITKKRNSQSVYASGDTPTGNERILLVDDELSIVKLEKRILEEIGYTVETRTSSIETLELFRSKPNDFDLIITDMTMPNMTGDQLAVELMKIRPNIPVILCTGYSRSITNETAANKGIKALVYKPIIRADLAKTIRTVLDSSD